MNGNELDRLNLLYFINTVPVEDAKPYPWVVVGQTEPKDDRAQSAQKEPSK